MSGKSKLRSASSGSVEDDINNKIAASHNERQESQKKTFTKWLNSKLFHTPGSPMVEDLFVDLRDGMKLLAFLEYATGAKCKPVKGKFRLHHIQNMNMVLSKLEEEKVKLIGISSVSIVDGDEIPTMGLLWSLIHRFQIQGVLAKRLGGDVQIKDSQAEKGLLKWCQDATAGYEGVEVKNFSKSWKDGLAFNAILHKARPQTFDFETLRGMTADQRLKHAFKVGKNKFNVVPLLEAEDFDSDAIDKRTVMMYVSTMYDTVAGEIEGKDQQRDVIIEEDVVDAVVQESVESAPSDVLLDDVTASFSQHQAALSELVNQLPPAPASNDLKELQRGLALGKDITTKVLTHESDVTEGLDNAHSVTMASSADTADVRFAIEDLEKTWHDSVDACLSSQARYSEAIYKVLDNKTAAIDKQMAELSSEHEAMNLSDDSLSGAQANHQKYKAHLVKMTQLEADIESWLIMCKDDSIQTLNESERDATTSRRDDILKRWNDLEAASQQRQQDLSDSLTDSITRELTALDDASQNAKNAIDSSKSTNESDPKQLKEAIESFEVMHEEVASSVSSALELNDVTNELAKDTTMNRKKTKQLNEKAKKTLSDLKQTQTQIKDKQQRVDALLTESSKARNTRLLDWKSKANGLDASLDKLEKSNGNNPDFDSMTIDELAAIEAQLKDETESIKVLELEIDSAEKTGDELINNDLISSDDAASVQRQIQDATDRWSSLQEANAENMWRLQKVSSAKQEKEADTLVAWNNSVGEFNALHGVIQNMLRGSDGKGSDQLNKIDVIRSLVDQIKDRHEAVSSGANEAIASGRLSEASLKSVSDEIETEEGILRELNDKYHQLDENCKAEASKRSAFDGWNHRASESLTWIDAREKETDAIGQDQTDLESIRDAHVQCMIITEGVSNYEKELDAVLKDGRQLITTDTVSDDDSQTSANLVQLEDKWNALKGNVASRQESIEDQLRDIGSSDAKLLQEWATEHRATDAWLTNIEEEMEIVAKEDPQSFAQHAPLAAALNNVEQKRIEKEGSFDKLVSTSHVLLSADGLKSAESKARIEEELAQITERHGNMSSRINDIHRGLDENLKKLQMTETEALDKWMNDANEAAVMLSKLEGEKPKRNNNKGEGDDVAKAKDEIKDWEGLVSRIEAFEVGIKGLSQRSIDLTQGDTLSPANQEIVQDKMRKLVDDWSSFYENAALKLKERQETLSQLLRANDDKLGYWLNEASALAQWLGSLYERNQSHVTSIDDDTVVGWLATESLLKECQEEFDKQKGRYEEISVELKGLGKTQEGEEQEAVIFQSQEQLDAAYDDMDIFLKDSLAAIHTKFIDHTGDLSRDCNTKLVLIEKEADQQSPVGNKFSAMKQNEADLSGVAERAMELQPRMDEFTRFCDDVMVSHTLSDDEKAAMQTQQNDLSERYNRVKQKSNASAQRLCLAAKEMLLQAMIDLLDNADRLERSQAQMQSDDDALDADRLHMRFVAIKGLLSSCDEHNGDVADLQSFVDDLLSSGVFTEQDHSDSIYKLKSVGERFDAIQTAGKYAKNSTYVLLMRLLRRKRQDMKERLIEVESALLSENYKPESLAEVVEKKRGQSAMLSKLDDIQRAVEGTTSLVASLAADDLIEEDDYSDLQDGSEKNVAHLLSVSETAHAQDLRLNSLLRSMLDDHLLRLRAWLAEMKSKMEEPMACPSDLPSIQQQLNQIKEYQHQLEVHGLSSMLRHNDPLFETVLDKAQRVELMDTEKDCEAIETWLDANFDQLIKAQRAWDKFRHCEISLLDYLKEKEEMLKQLPPVNLEDGKAVNQRLNSLEAINKDMESRKDEVRELHDTSMAVVDILMKDNMPVNNVKAQVADIHDCWNNTVKQVIESKSKLTAASDRIKALEDNMDRIRFWLDDTQTVLKHANKDISDEDWKDIEPQLERKCLEQTEKQKTVNMINQLRNEIDSDVDEQSRDLIHTDVLSINKDWDVVSRDLSYVPERRKKRQLNRGPCFCWCWRRFFIKYGYYS